MPGAVGHRVGFSGSVWVGEPEGRVLRLNWDTVPDPADHPSTPNRATVPDPLAQPSPTADPMP